MKRLTLIIILFLTTSAFTSLVQSNAGGFKSTSSTTPFTATTSAVGFGSDTTAGDFLVLIAWATTTGTSTLDNPSFTGVPTTSGFTWTAGSGALWNGSSDHSAGLVGMYYIQNAAAMSSSTTTTITASAPGSGVSLTLKVEFALYEFSGVAHSSALDTSATLSGSSSTPATGNLTTTATDLVIVAYSADPNGGANISQGSGYALGVNATTATIGQAQYRTIASGSIATAFSGGTEPNWGAIAMAFKPLASVAVPRRHGTIF